MGEKSLYERLGGEPAIAAVCKDFVERAAGDPKVNFFRKDVPGATAWNPSPEDLATFQTHLVQFVCVAAGGPQRYEGRSMKAAHRGMKITESQFNALAADLAASLDAFNVPAKEKGELLNAVAGTKKDIVEVM
jgi:hemoglobin